MDRTLGNMSSMSNTETVHEIRLQMGRNGGASLSRLALAFKTNDLNGSGRFNFTEFCEILGKAGLFCNRQALSRFYRTFDHDGREQVLAAEVLRAIQGELNERRRSIVNAAWNKISGGQSVVPLQQVLGSFDASRHPKVLTGERTEQNIFREFVAAFENVGITSHVSQEQFEDYHGAVSASEPYNDDNFVEFVQRSWGVSEGVGDDGSSRLIEKIKNVLREKVRQRTKSPYGSESEVLRKAFCSAGSGPYLTPKQFEDGLRVFGVLLDPEIQNAIYSEFDPEGKGEFNYNEFVAAMYEDNAISSQFAAKTRLRVSGQNSRAYLETGNMLLSTQQADAPKAYTVRPTAIFVLGGPETGKKEQCALVAAEFSYVHLSVNDLVDAEIADTSSQVGRLIKEAISNGRAVPAELMVGVIRSEMLKYVEEGRLYFVIEGFPRNVEYKQAWDASMGDVDIPFVILLDLTREVALQRSSDPVATNELVNSFEAETFPVIDEYARAGMVRAINSVSDSQQIFREVSKLIAEVPVVTEASL